MSEMTEISSAVETENQTKRKEETFPMRTEVPNGHGGDGRREDKMNEGGLEDELSRDGGSKDKHRSSESRKDERHRDERHRDERLRDGRARDDVAREDRHDDHDGRRKNENRRSRTVQQDDLLNQWAIHCQGLESKIELLCRERNQLQYDRDSVLRQRDKLQADVNNLQSEALKGVDTFQPEVDEEIRGQFQYLDQIAKSLIVFLCNAKTSLEPAAWTRTAAEKVWRLNASADAGTALLQGALEDEKLMRKVMKSIWWRFLDDELLHRAFLCYGGETAEKVDAVYQRLYPVPYADDKSAKWRSATALQMEKVGLTDDMHNTSVFNHLITEFKVVLNDLGYHVDESKLEGKLKSPLKKAIKFAQLINWQRAMFLCLAPDNDKEYANKAKDDLWRTNLDSEFPEVEKEMAGAVWFVVKPGLIKRGTGKGERLQETTVLKKSFVQMME